MRMKKTIIILFSVVITLGASVSVTDLYNRKQIDFMVDRITSGGVNSHTYLSLDNLCYINIHAYIDAKTGLFGAAGDYTPDEYRFGWRKLFASNPQLGYSALNIYGEYFIRQVNSHLAYDISQQDGVRSFSSKEYWELHINTIYKYKALITKLLLLSDKDLNYFIMSNTSNESSYEFNKWLLDNGIVDNIKWSPSKNWGDYPGDLLCLTLRVWDDFPEWNPRKFLTEVNKFSDATIKQIKETENL